MIISLLQVNAAHIIGLDQHLGNIGLIALLIEFHDVAGAAAVQRNLSIADCEHIMQGQYGLFGISKIF